MVMIWRDLDFHLWLFFPLRLKVWIFYFMLGIPCNDHPEVPLSYQPDWMSFQPVAGESWPFFLNTTTKTFFFLANENIKELEEFSHFLYSNLIFQFWYYLSRFRDICLHTNTRVKDKRDFLLSMFLSVPSFIHFTVDMKV